MKKDKTMTFFSLSRRPLMIAAMITATSMTPLLAAEDVEVVDPTTGETVALSEIDISALSEEDRQNIGDQLAELGVSPRGRPDLSDVEVVDPTTGETVALGDIDKESLSEEDRQDIGDQLAELGFAPGPRGGRSAEAEGDGETEVGEEGGRAAPGRGAPGRGGEGRGGEGRGGPRD